MASRATAEPLPALQIDRMIDPKVRLFQLAFSGDGLSIFVPHPRFWLRNVVKSVKRTHKKMQQVFAPVPLGIVMLMQLGTLGAFLASKSGSAIRNSRISHLLWNLDSKQPLSKYCNNEVRVAYLALGASGLVMSLTTVVHRMTLRFVLSYSGWIDEVRGPKSLKTKIWHTLLKYVYIRGVLTPTFTLQSCLPKQPVPSLRDTLDRYLLSMESLLPKDEFATVKAEGEKFISNEGVSLQRYLKFKYFTTNNYLADWWLQVVYLRGRESILINSNYFGLSLYRPPQTTSQAARAAVICHNFLTVKGQIDREQFPRVMIQDVVPLCMQQYQYAFNMTREPGHEIDKLVQYDSSVSRYLVVMHKGRFFKVAVYCHRTGALLSKLQLEAAFQGILKSCADSSEVPKEAHLAALTTLPRTEWAEIRTNLLQRDKINRLALKTIEQAIFAVSLDDTPAPYLDLELCGRTGIHGTGSNRWLDKSFNIVVTSDANVVMNGEHAWADAPTLAHILELSLHSEAKAATFDGLYATDGSIAPTPQELDAIRAGTFATYPPERLVFNVTKALDAECEHAVEHAKKLINELDLCSAKFTEFGKGAMKKAKCSPDAFIQMALQLAYYRDQGKFVQTYESSMARLYREGRTETIRSASNESVALVLAMNDASKTDADRGALLRKACEKHQRSTALAMTGRGCDRHMFALYVVAVGTGVDAPFLTTAMKRGWKLSTSQIPQIMNDFLVKGDGHEWPRPAGGFGPVASDGYGVCYTITGEDTLFFHVTCNRPCPGTDSKRMQAHIRQALLDLRRVGL